MKPDAIAIPGNAGFEDPRLSREALQAGELARAALFLALDIRSFVTGINRRVNGGMALL